VCEPLSEERKGRLYVVSRVVPLFVLAWIRAENPDSRLEARALTRSLPQLLMEEELEFFNGPSRDEMQTAIRVMKANIDCLQSKYYQLHERLNATTPMLSMLSQDVFTEIFIWAVDSQHTKGYDTMPMPLVIASICKVWRKIAFATPRLWRSVEICFSQEKEGVHKVLLQEWIGRTGNQTLDIVLHGGGGPGWQGPHTCRRRRIPCDPTKRTCQVLLDVAPRWRTFRTLGGPFHNLRVAIKDSTHCFQNLSSLRIEAASDHGVWKFRGGPLFKCLHIEGFSNASMYAIAWSHLAEITATLNTKGTLLVLRECSSLASFDLTLAEPNRNSNQKRTANTLQLLTKVRIKRCPSTMMGTAPLALFGSVIAPNLTSLELVSWELGEVSRRDFQSFIGDTQCSLTKLAIDQADLDSVDFMHILDYVPLLTELAVNSQRKQFLANEFFKRLNPDHPFTNYCMPNLKRVNFTGEVSFNLDAMISTIRARLNSSFPVCKLEHISLTYTNDQWARNQDPNCLKTFYEELVMLERDYGVEVSMTWIPRLYSVRT